MNLLLKKARPLVSRVSLTSLISLRLGVDVLLDVVLLLVEFLALLRCGNSVGNIW